MGLDAHFSLTQNEIKHEWSLEINKDHTTHKTANRRKAKHWALQVFYALQLNKFEAPQLVDRNGCDEWTRCVGLTSSTTSSRGTLSTWKFSSTWAEMGPRWSGDERTKPLVSLSNFHCSLTNFVHAYRISSEHKRFQDQYWRKSE